MEEEGQASRERRAVAAAFWAWAVARLGAPGGLAAWSLGPSPAVGLVCLPLGALVNKAHDGMCTVCAKARVLLSLGE